MGGIYVIKNIKENKYYIGSSIFPEYRIGVHKNHLLENIHVNKDLQNDFNKHGENNFTFEIVCVDIENNELNLKEKEYIDKLKSKMIKIYKKKNNENFKNIKIDFDSHYELKIISMKTGINMSKIIEMSAMYFIESYKKGEFDKLTNSKKQIRRDGTFF